MCVFLICSTFSRGAVCPVSQTGRRRARSDGGRPDAANQLRARQRSRGNFLWPIFAVGVSVPPPFKTPPTTKKTTVPWGAHASRTRRNTMYALWGMKQGGGAGVRVSPSTQSPPIYAAINLLQLTAHVVLHNLWPIRRRCTKFYCGIHYDTHTRIFHA